MVVPDVPLCLARQTIRGIAQGMPPVQVEELEMKHCVYLVRISDTRLFKIGRTKNFNARLMGLEFESRCFLGLRRSVKVKIDTVSKVECTSGVTAGRIEDFLHWIFRAYRDHGEWFRFPKSKNPKIDTTTVIGFARRSDQLERSKASLLMDMTKSAKSAVKEAIQ